MAAGASPAASGTRLTKIWTIIMAAGASAAASGTRLTKIGTIIIMTSQNVVLTIAKSQFRIDPFVFVTI